MTEQLQVRRKRKGAEAQGQAQRDRMANFKSTTTTTTTTKTKVTKATKAATTTITITTKTTKQYPSFIPLHLVLSSFFFFPLRLRGHVACCNLLLEDVDLVEKQNDRHVSEPLLSHNVLEQRQALRHAILRQVRRNSKAKEQQEEMARPK